MIVFLLRHADRPPAPPGAPVPDTLSPPGRERARLLARMLAESNVQVAYRSDFARTAQTLEPLVERLGGALTIREIKLKPDATDQPVTPHDLVKHINGVVTAVKSLANEAVVVVVGHDSTVGPIMAGLGGTDVAIAENEFDRLFVLFIPPGGPVTQLNLRYGAATPA